MDNFNPLVSIIIPVYNGANFMREAIDSALAQTYENIEVIVINDGSTDGGETDRIAKSYGDKIRYFSKPNGGVATALNLGIEKMNGEYFSWLSHDDVYLPDKVKAQIDLLRELNNGDYVIYSGYNLMNEKGSVYQKFDLLDLYSQNQLDTPLFNVIKGIANGCTMLIPKKYFNEYGFFDPTLHTTQDYELWFNMFRKTPIKYSSAINVNMRQHNAQGSKTINAHLEECNSLWISFIDRIKIEEMCFIDKTPKLFFSNMERFLLEASYEKALEHCRQIMERPIDYSSIPNGKIIEVLCLNYDEARDYIETLKLKNNECSVYNGIFSKLRQRIKRLLKG